MMTRYSIFCVLACMGAMGTVRADHFPLFHPRPVIMAPVVAYQPAYVVPVATYAYATPMPVTTVTYATSYYAPLVPMVAVAPVVYSPPVYMAPVYSVPVYGGYYGPRVQSRLNVHRNGSYNYHVRVR